jgi:N6-L-threonylcarbamoyladenine synthase
MKRRHRKKNRQTNDPMQILGIETSCDETGASVVTNGENVLSNIVASSLEQHKAYGGIIPEIASRRQLECIHSVVETALKEARIKRHHIDAIAVTERPGLIGSLLVGISFAQALSYALNVPLVKMDHIKAHLYASFLALNEPQTKQPDLPAVGLIVSGGHTSLYYIKKFPQFELLGQTRDDAAGETFDKVARILGLGYPGGPAIEKAARTGHTAQIRFRCAELPGSFHFSFSGIKTAVLYYKNAHFHDKMFSVNQVAYAFQESIVTNLVKKSIAACRQKKARTLLIGGGVAANTELRDQMKRAAEAEGIKTHFPPLCLCMDNAAMIAGLAFHQI